MPSILFSPLDLKRVKLPEHGRQLLRNPYFSHRAARKPEDSDYWPRPYLRVRK